MPCMKQKATLGISMNDYSIGALEALSWVLAILTREDPAIARQEIQEAVDRITGGTAINFKRKLELL